jgi:hypothetical protein
MPGKKSRSKIKADKRKVLMRSKLPDVDTLVSAVRAGDDPVKLLTKYDELSYGKIIELIFRLLCWAMDDQGIAKVRFPSARADIDEGWDVEVNGERIDFTTNSEKRNRHRDVRILYLPYSDLNRYVFALTQVDPKEVLSSFLNQVTLQTVIRKKKGA